jgi:hypothetical protein
VPDDLCTQVGKPNRPTNSSDRTVPEHWQLDPSPPQEYWSLLSERRDKLSGQSKSGPPESPWEVPSVPSPSASISDPLTTTSSARRSLRVVAKLPGTPLPSEPTRVEPVPTIQRLASSVEECVEYLMDANG